MFKPFLGKCLIGFEEKANLDEVILSQSLFRYNNPNSYCNLVEKKISHLLQIKHALVITNGTNAIKSALMVLRPKQGDVILIPAISFIATATACLSVGVLPIMIDVDDSGHMDPLLLVEYLKKNPPPTAVIAVHLDGSGCQINEIAEICKTYNLPLIEDTARSFGVCRKKRALGTFGDIGCFSFQENKLLSTGEGGALVTNDSLHFSRLNAYTDHGALRDSSGFPNWNDDLGFGENFKANELTAAVLFAQLHKFDLIRTRVRNHYQNLIQVIAKGSFFQRHEEDIPTTIWIDSSDLVDSLKREGAPLVSWKSLFLPEHPIIKEKRSLYRDGYPWNYLKFKQHDCERGRKICADRFNIPVPVLEENFQKLRILLEAVYCLHS